MKKYMKLCLSDLYRKISAQIRKDLRIKDAENRLKLYKFYIPLIVDAISDSVNIDQNKLTEKFIKIAEKHVKKELTPQIENDDKYKLDSFPENKITERKELDKNMKQKNRYLKNKNRKAVASENLTSRKKTTLDDFNNRS